MSDNLPRGLGLGARDSAPGGQDLDLGASASAHPRVLVLRWLENALLVVGILSLGWYAGIRMSTIVQQARDNRALERLVAEREAARARAGPSVTATPDVDEEAAPPAPRSVIGRLEVPRLGIMAIVREGTEPGTLRHAVGHISETSLPGTNGNAALAGHRDTFFRKLKEVRPGDHVVVTMPNRTVTYVVRDSRVVAPTETSVLNHSPEPTLTLVTCYPFNYVGAAPDRFVVRAVADRAETATAHYQLPSKPLAALAVSGLAPLPTSAPTLAPITGSGSGSASTRRLRPGVRKIKANAARSNAKKAHPSDKNGRKHGFWGRLGRILIGR